MPRRIDHITAHSATPDIMASQSSTYAGPTTSAGKLLASLNVPSPTDAKHEHEEVDSNWGKVTTVLVGATERKFLIHTNMLRRVPFFRACLDAPMKESQEGVVRLPEDDPAAFAEVAYWIYHGKLEQDLESMAQAKLQKSSSTNLSADIVELRLKTYLLAKKMLVEDQQNYCVDSLQAAYILLTPSAHVLAFVYHNFEPDDPLRALLLRRLAWAVMNCGGWKSWKEQHKSTYKKFMWGSIEHVEWAFEAVTKHAKEVKFLNGAPKCLYHVHSTTPRCM